MTDPADFVEEIEGDESRRLRFSGSLSIAALGNLSDRLLAYDGNIDTIDIGDIDHIDTVGAWIIHRTVRDSGAKLVGAGHDAALLIGKVAEGDSSAEMERQGLPPHLRVLNEIGEAVGSAFASLLGLVGFFGAILKAAYNVIRHPSRFRWNAVIRRFEVVGVKALGIIGLMSFLIGVVVAQQGAVQLRQFGAEVFTVNLVGRLTVRELGVLMTAIMVAGRSGSAFAAQIGTMKLTEEIDAMRTIGVAPLEALVLPRMLAVILMMPLLGFYASLMAIFGGGILSWIVLDIPPYIFVERIREAVPLTDLYVGLVKAPVFGAIIAMTGCYQGMLVESNAEEVGLRTTSAVVQAIFMVIVLDAFFAVFFTWVGWV